MERKTQYHAFAARNIEGAAIQVTKHPDRDAIVATGQLPVLVRVVRYVPVDLADDYTWNGRDGLYRSEALMAAGFWAPYRESELLPPYTNGEAPHDLSWYDE